MLSSILSYICQVKILSFIQKSLQLLFQLYFNCICIPIVLCENFLRNSSILSVILCNHQYHTCYMKSFSFFRKCLVFLFQLYSNSPCNLINESDICCKKYFNFINYPKFSSISSNISQRKIFSFISKCLHILLQLHSNYICMPTIVSVKVTTKIFKFYSFPMKFHNFIRYILCKIPQIYQKIYPLSFSTILLFICLPLYL